MRKVLLFSGLLLAGLVLSQIIPGLLGDASGAYQKLVQLCTMTALAFIMVHVGLEFEIDKKNLRQYGWDYVVAATAAAFPWIFCVLYFVLVLLPKEAWESWPVWKESLLAARFSAPTSAGVLFSMLAAAGLAATWVFKKARILAIFDDLDTVLLMIPLKMAMVGMRWQLGILVLVMAAMLWLAYWKLHSVRWPTRWPWVVGYSIAMVAIIEVIYQGSKQIDPQVPIHIEVLLPAFVLGCILRRGHAADDAGHGGAAQQEHHDHHDAGEARANTTISALFMLLVGLSMPSLAAAGGGGKGGEETAAPTLIAGALKHFTPAMGWGEIAFHVLIVTLLSNLGKMFPALCYRREASWRERLAVAIGMWPRGEVGAGVLVVSLGYGIAGPIVVIAMLCLATNLVLTGVFILMIKKLLGIGPGGIDPPTGATRVA